MAVLTLTTTLAQAQDLPWCYRDFNAAPYSNCSFSTAHQCFNAARLMGGVCERNQRPVGKTTGKRARVDFAPRSR